MAQKIEGRWATSPSGITTFTPENEHGGLLGPWSCGTMVKHDGPHEHVFTESEVKAILKDAERWIEGITEGKLLLSFDSIAKRHGISDPA